MVIMENRKLELNKKKSLGRPLRFVLFPAEDEKSGGNSASVPILQQLPGV